MSEETAPSVTVTLAGAEFTDGDVITFASHDGTALSQRDYQQPSPAQVTVAGGASSASTTIAILDDVSVEGDQSFEVSASRGATELARRELVIADNDSATVEFTQASASTEEGEQIEMNLQLRSAAGCPSEREFNVRFEVSDPGGTVDVGPTSTFIRRLTPCLTRVNYLLDTSDDDVFSGAREVVFTIAGTDFDRVAVGALSVFSATVTDNDPPPRLSIGDGRIVEGQQPAIAFPLMLDPAVSVPVTVYYETADGTAQAGLDYSARSGILTIAANQVGRSIEVPVTDDVLAEAAEETFSVTLRDPYHADLDNDAAIGTIVDDDIIRVSVDELTVTEGATSGMDYTVVLTRDPGTTVTVVIQPSSVLLVAVSRSELVFTPDGSQRWDLPQTVTVNAPHDANASDERVGLMHNLSDGGSTTERGPTVTVQVEDDDLTIQPVPPTTVWSAKLTVGHYREALLTGFLAGVVGELTSDRFSYGGFDGFRVSWLMSVDGEGLRFAPTFFLPDIPGLALWVGEQRFALSDARKVFDGAMRGQEYRWPDAPAWSEGQRVTAWFGVGAPPRQRPPVVVPSAPRIVSALPGDGTVTLEWTVPERNGNAPIRGYEYLVDGKGSGDLASSQAPWISTGGMERRVTAEGLVNGRVYLLRVRAVNAAGAGAPSAAVEATPHAAETPIAAAPASLAVADARVREAVGAKLLFVVTLDRAATAPLTVAYKTADGTARAGSDYAPASGILTFEAGDTQRTITVAVYDDAHQEGEETVTLTLGNAAGASIADGVATGTIEDGDPMPRSWLGWFGRAAADQVLTAVGARLAAGHAPAVAAMPPAHPADASAAALGPRSRGTDRWDGEAALAAWVSGESEAEERRISLSGLARGSGFTAQTWPAQPGAVTLWGSAAWTQFDGREDGLEVDGSVWAGLLGVDFAVADWLAGVAVAYQESVAGSYRTDDARGDVHTWLLGGYPYVGYRVSDGLRLWAAGGFGQGVLTLAADRDTALETTQRQMWGAGGVRGELVGHPAGPGAALAMELDGLVLHGSSEAVSGLAVAAATVSRVRLGLEGSYRFLMGGGMALTPRAAAAVRYDGGDAGSGLGLDVSGGLLWAAAGPGLTVRVSAHGLVMHQVAGLRNWGVAGAVHWDPTPRSALGPSLTVAPAWGNVAASGADTLRGSEDLARTGAGDSGVQPGARLDVEAAYGMPVFGQNGVGAPYLGMRLADRGRDYRLGFRLTLGGDESYPSRLTAELTRREPADGAPAEHVATLGVSLRR